MASWQLNPLTAPDPFAYRAVWGIPVKNRRGFDLLVARQLLWLPHARPSVRRMLFTEDEQPICPACGKLVTAGTPSVVCAALLADRDLQEQIARDPTLIATKEPDGQEAWWLLHGTCLDELTRARVQELNQRIELALRAATRAN
jgi:hypothetical protein